MKLVSGNIISDVSDHFSQFCILDSITVRQNIQKRKYRDYSSFSDTLFSQELSEINWDFVVTEPENNPNKLFSTFFNKVNKLINMLLSRPFLGIKPNNYPSHG